VRTATAALVVGSLAGLGLWTWLDDGEQAARDVCGARARSVAASPELERFAAEPGAAGSPRPARAEAAPADERSGDAQRRDDAHLETAPADEPGGDAKRADDPGRRPGSPVAELDELLVGGRLEEALELIERLLALDPSQGSLFMLRAEVLRSMGRTDEAARDEALALELGVFESLEVYEGAVVGRVLDAQGYPVAGARVSVLDGRLFTGAVEDLSGVDGGFAIELSHTQEQVQLKATAPGHAPAEVQVARIGDPRGVVLRLREEARLEVQVRDAVSGLPLEGAEVQVRIQRVTTDAEGRATFGSLPEGLHQVSVSAPGYAPFEQEQVAASSSALRRFEAALEPERRIAGTVRGPAGRPLAGVQLECEPWVGVSGPDGRFEIEGLAAGRHRLRATTEALGAAVELELGPRTPELDLVLQPLAELRVRVRRNGEPLWGQLTVTRFGHQGALLSLDAEEGRSSARLPAGRVKVAFRSANLQIQREVELLPGGVHDVDLNVATAASRARVLRTSGEPAGGCWVVLYRNGELVGYVVADAEGNAELQAAPGVYEVYVRDRAEHRVLHVAGVRLPGELELTVPLGGRVSGQLLDPQGSPLAGQKVHVRGVQHPTHRQATTDAAGRFLIEELYDGEWALEVDAGPLELEALRRGFPSLGVDPLRFSARAGETSELSLRAR